MPPQLLPEFHVDLKEKTIQVRIAEAESKATKHKRDLSNMV